MGTADEKCMLTCKRCGRQEYCTLANLVRKGWCSYTYTACPACSELVTSVSKSIMEGKSVSIPAVKDYQY